MKLAVVINPEGAQAEGKELEKALLGRSVDARWYETTEDDPGLGQTERAIREGADVVVACGGDGTVRACAQSLVDTGASLGVIPAGTGNLLARNRGIPLDVKEALDVVLGGHVETMDVGRLGEEVFTVMAGAGLDAVIMDETSSEAKDRFGVAAYVLEGVKHVFDDPFQATVEFENDLGEMSREEGSWATILVGNLGRLQGGVEIFPDAVPDDGRLDLVGLRADGAAEAVAAGVSAATGSTDSDRLLRAQAPAFHLVFEEPMRYELDGEPRDQVDELSFRVLPGALRILGPAG